MRSHVVLVSRFAHVCVRVCFVVSPQVDILLNSKQVPELSFVCHRSKAQVAGRRVCEKLRENIDRQQFEVVIQAAIGNKVGLWLQNRDFRALFLPVVTVLLRRSLQRSALHRTGRTCCPRAGRRWAAAT